MHRISREIETMKPHYDVVVIGSGYGGAISASRMARTGKTVCVLERGAERQAGEYPRNAIQGGKNLQFNMASAHLGSHLGMFEVHVNEDMNAVVGCGLGGTSLINANVSLRPEPRLWDDPRWPAKLIADRETLIEEGFERASAMLGANPLPQDYPNLPKLDALLESARGMGKEDKFYRPPINVTFTDGPNAAGVEQKRCVGCGDCMSGCNYDSKNTTLMNYLPDAVNHGAEIFCGCDVDTVLPAGDGRWTVSFKDRGVGREDFEAPDLSITADVVIISAGAINSTALLLRSKAAGLSTSDQLGQHFTGNGDVLAFAYDTDRVIRGVGFGSHAPGTVEIVGPCITGIIDVRDTPNVRDGYVIEEGSMPGVLSPLLPAMLSASDALSAREAKPGWKRWFKTRLDQFLSLFLGSRRGAMLRSQTYLVMAHDDEKGRIEVQDGRPRINWPRAGHQQVFKNVDDALFNATKAIGGDFVSDPIWSPLLGRKLVTVHPLGGCAMGESAATGAVDHMGAVFSGNSGTDVHKGLYVADGAVMPMSLGVNPLLTISAISERSAALIAKQHGWTIDYTSKGLKFSRETHIGVRFTETMKGDFALSNDPSGVGNTAPMQFTLTIDSDNLDAMLTDPRHVATMSGTLECAVLSDQPMTVSHGRFNLFKADAQAVDTRNMIYRMIANTPDGKSFYFHGEKVITETSPANMWAQTTTLYVTVYESEAEQAAVVGKGVLHIHPIDFAKQMTTMTITNAPDEVTRLKQMVRFGSFFAGVLWDSYGEIFAPEQIFNPDAPPRQKRPLRVGAPEVHWFDTSDGVPLRLTRYQGGDLGPVMLIHGAGVSSGIFSTDLIDTNLLEFLYANKFDVWLFDYRDSIALPSAAVDSNGDQVARIDHPEAIAKVVALTGAKDIQVIAHCYGATTFTMTMLAGVKHVRSVLFSQVSADMLVGTAAKIKAGLHVATVLEALGVDSMTAYRDTHANWKVRLFDDALRLYPVKHGEACTSAVCHRITFMYSMLYDHAQLNERLHDNLHELFGVATMPVFDHLSKMIARQHVVAFDGSDSYMPHLGRMDVPITFICGADNQCYLPESTLRTYDKLCALHGAERYRRHVVPGYGHIDCIFGKDAARDVYPLILEHLQRTQ